MPRAIPDPPPHLATPTAGWWRSVVTTYELDDHHLRLLRLACEAWDRGQQAREAIDTEGLTYTDRFDIPRARPEIAIERDARIAFARLIRELGLDSATPADPRPPVLRHSRR